MENLHVIINGYLKRELMMKYIMGHPTHMTDVPLYSSHKRKAFFSEDLLLTQLSIKKEQETVKRPRRWSENQQLYHTHTGIYRSFSLEHSCNMGERKWLFQFQTENIHHLKCIHRFRIEQELAKNAKKRKIPNGPPVEIIIIRTYNEYSATAGDVT